MLAEIAFPHATGVVLFAAAALILVVYRRTGVVSLVYLALGFIFVGIESFLDGYEAQLLYEAAGGDWNALAGTQELSKILMIDTIRGIFIVLWASMEVMFAASLSGSENKAIVYGVPAAIAAIGTIQTIYFNHYSGITPLSDRIYASSAIRVMGILVPVALIVGGYLLASLYRTLQTKSILFYGLGFVIHGLTLPTYTVAKEAGTVALGLWYAFGGVIPALFAVYATILLEKESKEAV